MGWQRQRELDLLMQGMKLDQSHGVPYGPGRLLVLEGANR